MTGRGGQVFMDSDGLLGWSPGHAWPGRAKNGMLVGRTNRLLGYSFAYIAELWPTLAVPPAPPTPPRDGAEDGE